MTDSIILNYGCPRTGTTFMNQMLGVGVGFKTGKMAEGHSYHPINSKNGLLNLNYTFQKYNLVFVRTFRDPINIFESFYHATHVGIEGLGGKDYEKIKKTIEQEEANTNLQKEVKIINVNFDKMVDIEYSRIKIFDICEQTSESKRNMEIFSKFVEERYGILPVRQGRLSDNSRSASYLTDEEKESIRKIDYIGNRDV